MEGDYGRYALVIGNSQYDSSKLYRNVRFGSLEGPDYDSRHIAEELEGRAFKVTRCFNIGSQGLRKVLDEFCRQLRERQSQGRGRDEILLMYYAGHGVRTMHDDEEHHGGGTGCPELREPDGRRDPRAVGTDSRPLNLNQHFVRAVDEVARDAGNSIILMMDACLQDVGLQPRRRANDSTMHQPAPHSQQSTRSNNLKVCAHACEPGKTAAEHYGRGVWTAAVVRSMRENDRDVVKMLRRSAADRLLKEAGQRQYWLLKPGTRDTCSLERPLSWRVSSTMTDDPTSQHLPFQMNSASFVYSRRWQSIPGHSATLERKLRYIHYQLDSIGTHTEVLGSLKLLPPSQDRPTRITGGQSVVQMAQCVRTQSEYAMKFFVNQEDFEDERSMYLRSDGTISEHLAADLKLPCHHIILDNHDQRLKDRDGKALPPCIVIERGESLDLWSQRARPGPFIAFAVRSLAASHTGICGMYPFHILSILSGRVPARLWRPPGVHVLYAWKVGFSCMNTLLQVIKQVAERLKVLHEAGLVHRDLKPANILWLPRLNAWTIIDFACAAPSGQVREPAFTLQYASPEAVRAAACGEGMLVSAELDGWSLGVVAFELLTGEAWTPRDMSKQQLLDYILDAGAHDWDGKLSTHKVKQAFGRMYEPLTALLQAVSSARPSLRSLLYSFDMLFQDNTPPQQGPDGTSNQIQLLSDPARASHAALSPPPQLNLEVQDIPTFCKVCSELPEGATASFDDRLLTIDRGSHRDHANIDESLKDTPLWPCHSQLVLENLYRGIFSLEKSKNRTATWTQRPPEDRACRIRGGNKTVRNVVLSLRERECIVLDGSCAGVTFRNVDTRGGVIVCMGIGCNVNFEEVQFDLTTLVVVGGAAVTLSNCRLTSSLKEGSKTCVLVHGHGSKVLALEGCHFKGGLQCVSIHAGAVFDGQGVHCSDAAITGLEVNGEGSQLKLQAGKSGRRCKITNIFPEQVTYDLGGDGVFVNRSANAQISALNVTMCYRGVWVFEQSRCEMDTVVIRRCREVGFHITPGTASSCILRGCSVEDAESGISVLSNDGQVQVLDGEVVGCKLCGVSVQGGANVTVKGLRSSQNEIGFMSSGFGTVLMLEGCESSGDDRAHHQQFGGRLKKIEK